MIELRMAAGEYEYDVFFSYKRHDLTLEWTRGLHRRLKYYLADELGGKPASLFVDEDCIETGDRWPERLRESLRLSRCMVCLWSPSYFQSHWCLSEWASFREREKLLKMNSHGLIAPIRYNDGEHFPQEAREVQWIDVAPYTSTVPAFWASQRALDLEDKVKELARCVAKMVESAPRFVPDWPIVEARPSGSGKIEVARL